MVRNLTSLDDLVAEHGPNLCVGPIDVSDPQSVRDAVDSAFETMGRIDVVLSNAGYGIYAAAEEFTDRQLLQIIATNLVGSMQIARTVLPHLRAQGSGHIIQMSSMAGHFGQPGFTAYHATKWGIEGFYEALSDEVAQFGIATTILAPGRFPTSFYDAAERPDPHPDYRSHPLIRRKQGNPDDMPGDPDRLAELIIDVGRTANPPRRLLLGSDAYSAAHESLSRRLLELEHQKDIAYGTDREATP